MEYGVLSRFSQKTFTESFHRKGRKERKGQQQKEQGLDGVSVMQAAGSRKKRVAERGAVG
ncbi:MAG: hypothetical protein DCC57_05490 [Chloroflexi bacterium]|nr:MAG: hypothetical protein DCC57_05490 [Chloroflexota bacterium]